MSQTDANSPTAPPELTDRMFAALSDPYRRAILAELLHSPELSVDDGLAATRRDEDHVLDEDTLRVALHHVHLPQLAEGGFVAYSAEANRIAQGPEFDAILPLLRLIGAARETLQISWP